MSKAIIMTGDLSMVPPVVVKAITTQYGHHRFAWFQDILIYINNYFINVFGSDYQVLLLTSTLSGAKEALDFDNLNVLDISSSLGVDKYSFEDKRVDAYIIAPERALMTIPGTTIIVIKKESIVKVQKNLEQLEFRPYLLDIVKAYNAWDKKQTTPYSPNISSVVGLVSSLKFIESHGGLIKSVERHKKMAMFIRGYLKNNNFEIINDKSTNSFTVCKTPDNVRAEDMVNKLDQQNIFVKLESSDDNIIKVGHIGYVSQQALEEFVNIFDTTLGSKTGVSFDEINKYIFDESEKFSEIILNSVDEKLLTPGPTYFNPEVFDVMDRYTYYNSEKFTKDFTDLSNKLSVWMGAHNPTLIMSAPSTGFMEAAVSNLTRADDRGLVISHGKFGDRWLEICQAKNREFVSLELKDEEWGKAFSMKEIEGFLIKQDKVIDFICFQQNETSSGVSYNQNQVQEIVRVARQHNPEMIIIMDFVSGAFAHDINFDGADIDAMIIGSQKGLGISSGIAFMTVSDRAISRLLELSEYSNSLSEFIKEDSVVKYMDIFESKQKVGYLNILKLALGLFKKQIADMPNIFHVYSALKSLDLIEKLGGRDYFINRHASLAKKIRDYIENELGLEILGNKDYLSNAVSLVLFPDNIDAREIKKALKEQCGFSVAGAQSDYWKPKFIRVGHLGYVDDDIIDDFLQAFKEVLNSYK